MGPARACPRRCNDGAGDTLEADRSRGACGTSGIPVLGHDVREGSNAIVDGGRLGANHMTTFSELGVQVKRSFHSSTMTVGAVDISNKETTRLQLTLPRPSKLRASFRKESWGDAIVKVFKKEIQTGDKEFDDLVYITTDTPEETKAFLTKDDVRNAIALNIDTAGSIEIDGARVVAHVAGRDSGDGGDDQSVVTIVRAALEA